MQHKELQGTGNGFAAPASRRTEAVAALLTERTIEAAAKRIGVDQSTLHRWLKDPTFAEQVRLARREAVRQAVARLQQASATAVDVLVSVMLDEEAHDSSRVRAAKTVLEMAFKAVETDELAARIEALEFVLRGRRGA